MYANGYPPPNGHLPASSNGHLSTSSNGHLSVSTPSCHRAISYDSGCTSPSASEVLLLNHDYADPIEIKESIKHEMQKIDRQKRQNLLYEPMTAKNKQMGGVKSGKSNNNERVCKCTTQTLCLVFVFVVSSCSLGLCLLITFGILDVNGNQPMKGMNQYSQ